MFSRKSQRFLQDLKSNNEREWFHARKEAFKEHIEKPAKLFAADLADKLSKTCNEPIKARIFRIYRDIRFSLDKTPYNAHVHIAFFPEKYKSIIQGGFYWGFETHHAALSVGDFAFSSEGLNVYRNAICNSKKYNYLLGIIKDLNVKKSFREPSSPRKKIKLGYFMPEEIELKRIPSHFRQAIPNNAEAEEFIRRKSLYIWQEYAHSKFFSANAANFALQNFLPMKPLYTWLRSL